MESSLPRLILPPINGICHSLIQAARALENSCNQDSLTSVRVKAPVAAMGSLPIAAKSLTAAANDRSAASVPLAATGKWTPSIKVSEEMQI